MKYLTLLAIFLCVCSTVVADQVTIRNGKVYVSSPITLGDHMPTRTETYRVTVSPGGKTTEVRLKETIPESSSMYHTFVFTLKEWEALQKNFKDNKIVDSTPES